MKEPDRKPSNEVTWRKKPLFVLGAWTLLMVVVWVFHWWRVYAAINFDWGFDLLGFPVTLLVVDITVIAGGFWLLQYRHVRGLTASQQYYRTLYVGSICIISMSLLFVAVLRSMFWGVASCN